MPTSTIALAALLCSLAQSPQEDVDATARERFAQIPTTKKAMLVARVRGRLLHDADPAYARIAALQFDVWEMPDAEPAPAFGMAGPPSGDGSTTPGAGRAPSARRTLVTRDQPAHRKIALSFARAQLLPDLHAHVHYDWCDGRIEAGEPLEYEQVFDNLLRGFPPGADQAVATVLAKLDAESGMRKLAHWFGHLYANLDGQAFEDITLYDAWYSGRHVDVPDIDALPFAHDVLGRRSIRGPLGGRTQSQIYEAIRQASLLYRVHRTTCEAAAAAYVAADPKMDEVYARLVPRFHYLFALHGDDLALLKADLEKRDRDGMIADVDRKTHDADDPAATMRDARHAELTTMAQRTRDYALAELEQLAPAIR